MKKLISASILLITISLSFWACKSESKSVATKTNNVEVTFKCDDKITYTSIVKNILDARCVKCHRGEKPAKNYDLSTYAGASVVNSNALVCAISAGPDCKKMPPMGSPLSDEQVAVIKCWIKNGKPE